MIEHDLKLCEKAMDVYDSDDYIELEALCITAEGKKFIHDLAVREYHREEAKAGMI